MSNGIDFVIGGKDKAKPAMTSVEKSLQRLEQKTDSVSASTKRLAAVGTTLAAAWGLVKTAMAALGGLDKINAAYAVQTKAVKDLTSALAVRGQATAGQSAQMQQMAADLQKLTGVGDEVTIGLQKQALAMGFATNKIGDATKAAIGLADVTGNSLEGSLSDLKAALEGNFSAFEGINPQIRFMRSNQEKLAAVMAIASQGLKQQSESMNTVAGSGMRASGAFGDLLETIGAIIAPIRVLINAGIQQLSESLISLLAPAAQYATSVLENIGPIMDWVKEKVIQGVNLMIGEFTFFETILTNLSSVWEIVTAAAELAMITVSESVIHTLTVKIPAYAMWFGENFINLIKDAFNGVITVVTNAGKIIGEVVYQAFEFIASGGAGGIDGLMENLGHAASMSLLDGFKSSLTSLPEIAGRQLTEKEKDLADKIGKIGGRLGDQFSKKMKDRMIGVGSTLGDEMNAATKGFNLQGRQGGITQGTQATEGRLLTRGPGTSIPNLMQQLVREVQDIKRKIQPKQNKILVQLDGDAMDALHGVQENTSNTLQMEAIA